MDLDSSKITKLIIGLDYGSTGTAISILMLENHSAKHSRQDVRDWPPGKISLKVPSRIAYRADNLSFSMPSTCWGYEIHPIMNSHFWTKLLLDGHVTSKEFDDKYLTELVSLSGLHPAFQSVDREDAEKVVTDYLRHVLRFTRQILEANISPALDFIPVDLRFTVPATWSLEARESTRRAVNAAWEFRKFQDTLTSMSEPEAAAEAVFSYLRGEFQVGDGILICDCGGGTVDITSYLVTECTQYNFSRIASLKGAKCGGAAIDSRLLHLLKQRIPGAFNYLNHLIAPGSDFMNEFEAVKSTYGLDVFERPVRLPLSLRRGLATCNPAYFDPEQMYLTLTKEDLQSLFEPVISNIVRLVSLQISTTAAQYGTAVINKIVLVGGLGSSPYLQKIFRRHFESLGTLNVIVPTCFEPISAVAIGSTLRGLRKDRPVKLRSPKHYGLAYSQGSEYLHRQVDANDVEWVFFKGFEYEQGFTSTHNFTAPCRDDEFMVLPILLYASDSESPPDTLSYREADIMGIIKADFRSLDLTRFYHEKHGNHTLYRLEFCVQCRFDAENDGLHFTTQALGAVIGRETFWMNVRPF